MEKNDKLTRRDAIKVTAGASVLSMLPFTPKAKPSLQNNVIVQENRKEGSKDWQLTRVRQDASNQRTPFIEGYCSRQSVKAGETIDIMVSVGTKDRFKLEIFRTGYYGGRGARLMKTYDSLEGFEQPTPEPGNKISMSAAGSHPSR